MKAILPALVIVLFATIVTGTTNSRPDGSPLRERPVSERTRNSFNFFAGTWCVVLADVPARNRDGGQIVGAARFRCDGDGGTVSFTLELQRRAAGGAWTTVASQAVRVSGAETTGSRSLAQRTRSVSAACATGEYRTVARGTINASGQSRAIDEKSWTARNPCDSPRR